ncbi:MAG: transposase [Firmicutes bacterium]|nr:transposase [Bacillota bacterium]
MTPMTHAERTPEEWAAEVARLEQQIAALTLRIPWDEEQFRLAKHRQYGASQERSDAAQRPLFNEAEAESRSPVDAPQDTVTYTRRKKTPGQRDAALAHLPVERIVYDLPNPSRCATPVTGGGLS